MWHGPLEWEEVAVVNLDVVVSVLGNGLLLGETNAAVLQWSEDGRRNILIVALPTHTPVWRPFSETTRVSRCQKGKTNLDITEARDSEWQWHQLEQMQVWIDLRGKGKRSMERKGWIPHSRQITMPAPYHSVFTGRMPFLPPNQQRQSTESRCTEGTLSTHTQ